VISDPVERQVIANRNKIAAFLVNRSLNGSNDIVLISLENVAKDRGYVHMSVEQIVLEFPQTMAQRVLFAMHNLVSKSDHPGAEVRIESLSQSSIFYLEHANFESMSYVISSLEKKGLITVGHYGPSFFPCNIVVTLDGWELVSSLETKKEQQDDALVAISGANDYSHDYVKEVAKSCRSNGFRALEYPCYSGEEKIGNRLIAAVRESRFVICDLTDGSQEAYFSLGLARALEKPVIITCRTAEKSQLKIDKSHLSVIFWDSHKKLGDEISNAIRATIF